MDFSEAVLKARKSLGPNADPDVVMEQACKLHWDSDPNIQAEFSDDFETYVSYREAQLSGRVRVIGKPIL